MRLQHITIDNCAWCPDLSVDVRGHLVVVGPNEAGKSSLLRLLDAALCWPSGRLLSELSPGALANASEALVVEAILVDLDDDAQAAFPDEIEVAADGSLSLTVRMEVRVSDDDPTAVDVQRDFVKDGVRPIRVLQRHLPHLRWTYLRASRPADRELGRSRSSAITALLGSINLDEADRTSIIDAIDALNTRLAHAESIESLRNDIAGALSEVYPRPVDRSDVSIQLPSTHDPLGDVDVRLAGTDGEPASLLEQSDGIRSLSVMSLQLLVRGGVAITAIDEPEIHLHPRSQARVAGMLAKKPGQRLVATHAPAVVRAFKPSEVLALTLDGARQLPPGAIESDAKFFSQWWVDATLEPLTARGVILVEGVSDEALVRTIARLDGVDLDREGISVVSLGGAWNFPNAYKLFGPGGFEIRVTSLVDEEEVHLPAGSLDVEVAELPAHGVFVAVPDLEAEYCEALGAARVVHALTASGLFTVGQILKSTKRGTVNDVGDDDVKAFCGTKKHKTKAALAVCEALTPADVAGFATLPRLVAFACRP